MATPVWVLSVDLQTKTATFQSGMADAARSAKGAFSEIKDGASGMGGAVGRSSMEARHSLMLMAEEFGVHLPRGVTMFLSSLGPVAATMSAAFPFAAIAVGAAVLLQHLEKMREESEQLANAQGNFGNASAVALDHLKEKLLDVQRESDELAGDHVGALHKQIEALNLEKLDALRGQFSSLQADVTKVFNDLKTQWYEFGSGSAGAIADMDKFKIAYDAALSGDKAGNGAKAQTMLNDKLQDSIHLVEVFNRAKQGGADKTFTSDYAAAMTELHGRLQSNDVLNDKMGDSLRAQVTFYEQLNEQAALQQKITAGTVSNATQTTQKKTNEDQDRDDRADAEFARRSAEDAETVREQSYREAVEALQEHEREMIDGTKEGSAARLAAIDAAIQEENAQYQQGTQFYKELMQDRLKAATALSEDMNRVQEEAGKESAQHTLAMAKLQEEAEEQADKRQLALHHASLQATADAEAAAVQRKTQIEVDGYNREIAALDKFAKDYEVKYKALKDKITETERSADNQIVQIQGQAAVRQTQMIQSAYSHTADIMASTLAKMVQGHKSFAEAARQAMGQVVEALAESLIKEALMRDREKLGAAKTAAAKAFAWAPNPIIGAPLAAAAFADVMAYEKGGIVGGTGAVDTVPAMLTPGEAVLPKGLTEMLSNAAKHGNEQSSAPATHVHYSPTIHVNTLDSDGVNEVLTKHADTFHQHFENHVRRMNR